MIVVTGGAGFIGSALVWGLNRRGRADILIVDRMPADRDSDPKSKNLKSLKYADYLDADAFLSKAGAGAFDSGVDAILHMGANSSTTETDVSHLRRNNTEYTQYLAEFSMRRGVRFVYASSAATYGDGSQGYSDDPDSLAGLRPLNFYGWSKQWFDQWAASKGWLDRIAGLKYFNVFGPNEYHKGDMRSVVVKAYEQIRAAGRVRLFKSHRPDYADGEQVRDFLYVKDAVDATLFFLDHPGANGLFNIGSGRANTWKALVTPVFDALNLPVDIEFIDMPVDIRSRYQYHTEADPRRLRAAGFRGILTPLGDAVREYVRDYLVPGAHLIP